MKKSSIILIVVIVIAVLLALVAWALNGERTAEESNNSNGASSSNSGSGGDPNSNNSNGDPDDPVSNLVVSYDGSAFSPETLTVSQGDTVTFRNDSSTDVWPASDDHPTHTNLSGFDPQSGLEPGEEYSFTFNEAGEWGYHNHLNPGQTGTIIVE